MLWLTWKVKLYRSQFRQRERKADLHLKQLKVTLVATWSLRPRVRLCLVLNFWGCPKVVRSRHNSVHRIIWYFAAGHLLRRGRNFFHRMTRRDRTFTHAAARLASWFLPFSDNILWGGHGITAFDCSAWYQFVLLCDRGVHARVWTTDSGTAAQVHRFNHYTTTPHIWAKGLGCIFRLAGRHAPCSSRRADWLVWWRTAWPRWTLICCWCCSADTQHLGSSHLISSPLIS